MNLILIQPDALDPQGRATLPERSARHVLTVLKGHRGQTLRVGVVNGRLGTGVIESIEGETVRVQCELRETPPPEPAIDLLLALPRPKVIKRIWAPMASMGIRRLFITNAEKVERNYFDTHWLDPAKYMPLLIEGLEQAGDTRVPEVRIVRRLKPFLEDELPGLCPGQARILAHPGGTPNPPNQAGAVLLAVGPEGGWSDFELAMFDRLNFSRLSLGWRRLRTDTACVALVSALRNMLAPASRPP